LSTIDSVCLSGCPSVTPLQIDSSFLCLDRIEIFFGRQLSMYPSTKLFSSIFDLRPLKPKIYSRNFWHKIAYKSACMADRPEMFGPTRGFSGMADSMEPCKMLWADPCCRGNEIWARRGDLSPTGLYFCVLILCFVYFELSYSLCNQCAIIILCPPRLAKVTPIDPLTPTQSSFSRYKVCADLREFAG